MMAVVGDRLLNLFGWPARHTSRCNSSLHFVVVSLSMSRRCRWRRAAMSAVLP
jgi:hypothetical protein